MSDADPLQVEQRDATVVLTFNRPEKLNAISSAMLDAFDRALLDAERDEGVRAVIVTGAGHRAFVAGADIGEYAAGDHEAFVRYQRRSREVFARLDGLGTPVIAAVNGYALGGGFEIALCCDVVLAARSAAFGLPEGLLGLSPGGGGTQRLTRAAGPFVAADVLLAARHLTAEDAHRLGLVADVVESDALRDAALARAAAMASVAPLASAELLRLVTTAMDARLDEGLNAEHEALFRLHGTADAAEGVRAFVEKRAPRFRGA